MGKIHLMAKFCGNLVLFFLAKYNKSQEYLKLNIFMFNVKREIMKERVLMLFACLFASVMMAMAQTSRVTGTVVDESGEPVIGASVLVDGTSRGAVTNIDGVFVIENVPSTAETITVSYVGFQTQKLNITRGRDMNIVLRMDAEMLDEVLVVAYGTTKRSAFTGSAMEVKTEDIANHVTSSATNALVGKVAGVQATSAGGPGSAPTIRIRGIGSYAAGSTPLYIIDGVPMDQSVASVNPSDIESMSVLKDASASAIYGARGANGVVIITTKKAKGAQDARVTFDAKFGSNSRLIPQYDVISDPGQYYETQYKALYNSIAYNGGTPQEAYAFADKNLYDQNNGGLGYQVFTVPEGQKLIGTNFRLNPNATLGYSDGNYYYTPDDWYNEVFHNSFRQEYNVSVTGGTDRLSYFASAGYLNDGGNVSNSRYQRYSSRSNVEYQAKKWLKLTTNMSFTHTDQQAQNSEGSWGSSGNIFYITNNMGAIYPLYVRNADGSLKVENGRQVYDSNQTGFMRPSVVGNAVRDNEYNSRKTYTDIFMGQWGATVTPIEGLDFTANLSATSINSRRNILYSVFASGAASDGGVDVTHSRRFAINQQYMVNWNKTFNEVHNVSVLAGYEQYKVKSSYLEGYNDHLYDPYIGELDNAKGMDQKSVGSSTSNKMNEGFFGRLQYDYANKYFFNASIRRDASSIFAPGHRWGTFGSVGAAWALNEEDFLKDVDWIDLLKAKISWGSTGNDDMRDPDGNSTWYPYTDQYNTDYNNGTGEYSIAMSFKGNENLTWEKKKAINVGVDFSLFGYRLNGTLEYYNGSTTDLLYYKSVPLSAGLTVSSYPVNVGKLINRGWELSLDGTIIKKKNFDWNVNLALSTNHNEFTELDPSVEKTGIRGSSRIVRVGGSMQQGYMVKYAGVDPENGRAQYFVSYDADGNRLLNTYGDAPVARTEKTYDITEASLYDVGDLLPDVQGGFGTTVNAFGFDLSAQFSFSLGGRYYDGSYQQLMHNGQSAGSAMHKDLLDAWSPENKDSDIPRLSTAAIDDPSTGSQTTNTRFLTSSDYLQLNNITLGYTLPRSITRNLQMQSVRVYVAGENLFVLTARKGMDPRFNLGVGGYTNTQSSSYSTMRTVTAGISVTF